MEGRLIVADGLHLGGRGTLGIETVCQPVGGKLLGQLDPDNALPETQHLSVVAQNRPLHGERVVRGDSPDARHLVGRDGDTQARAANEETAVGLAFFDQLGTGDGGVGVGGLVGGRLHTHVGDGGDEGVLF